MNPFNPLLNLPSRRNPFNPLLNLPSRRNPFNPINPLLNLPSRRNPFNPFNPLLNLPSRRNPFNPFNPLLNLPSRRYSFAWSVHCLLGWCIVCLVGALLAWLVHFLLWQAAKPSGDKCTPLKAATESATNLQGVQLSQLHQQSSWHSFAWSVHCLLGWCTACLFGALFAWLRVCQNS